MLVERCKNEAGNLLRDAILFGCDGDLVVNRASSGPGGPGFNSFNIQLLLGETVILTMRSVSAHSEKSMKEKYGPSCAALLVLGPKIHNIYAFDLYQV